MKYRIGDKVVTRDDLEDYVEYDRVIYLDDMNEYRGKVGVIQYASNGIYKINGWFWSEGMIDHEKTAKLKSTIHLTNGVKLDLAPYLKSTRNANTKSSIQTDVEDSFYNNEEELKMLNNNFTKSDLKTGMVVQIKNKDTFLVLIDTIGYRYALKGESILNHKKETTLPLYEYNDKLQHNSNRNFDIIEVRKLSTVNDIFHDYNYDDLELLWERNKPIRYISGFLFGDNIEFMWKSEDIECFVGDIVEVQTLDGLQLAKVLEVMFVNGLECDENFADVNNVVRRIEL